MGCDIKRLARAAGTTVHQRVMGRGASGAFFRRGIGTAAQFARMPVAMFRHQPVQPGTGMVRQCVIDGAHIDEFGIAAVGRKGMGRQQRIGGAHLAEGHIGVPQTVGALEQQPAVAFGVDIAVLIHVALIHHLVMRDADAGAGDLRCPAAVHGAKLGAEGNLLLVRWRAVMGDGANRVAVHRRDDVAQTGRIHRATQIDTAQAGSEQRVQRCGGQAHGRARFSYGYLAGTGRSGFRSPAWPPAPLRKPCRRRHKTARPEGCRVPTR